jgi:hypothetical protein
MKKIVFIGLIALASITISMVVLNGHPGFDDSYERTNFDRGYGPGYCHGAYRYDEDNLTYDFLYHRLTEDDQAMVDLMLSKRISELDMSQFTETEKIESIEDIKDDLVDYILDAFDYVGTDR